MSHSIITIEEFKSNLPTDLHSIVIGYIIYCFDQEDQDIYISNSNNESIDTNWNG